MTTTALRLGAQYDAALTVEASIVPLEATTRAALSQITTELGTVSGEAAAGVAVAIARLSISLAALPTALSEYAQRLASVDETVGASQLTQAQEFAQLRSITAAAP